MTIEAGWTPRADHVGVPADLAAVDAAWVEAALRHNGLPVSVAGVRVDPIAVGEGFIGLLARVTPTYSSHVDGAPASLVVKLPNPDPGAQMMGAMLRLWDREGSFYEEIAPRTPVRVPRAYLVSRDAENRVALLLEDLGHLSAEDQLAGTSRERAEAAIDWLASFHAAGWGIVENDAHLPWVPRPDDGMYTAIPPLALANWDMFTERFGALLEGERHDRVRTAIDDVLDFLQVHDHPFTVGHGDFRLANMLFDGVDLVMLDWQLIHVAQFGYDLTYFLAGSLSIEQRRAWERELLERYRAQVNELANAGLSESDVLDAYRMSIRFLLGVMPTTTVSLDFDVNERARATATELVSRFLAASDDYR